jgi:uncharacterized membrane protein YeaQ/YmgE (transglycosylase-associated protein family)
MAVANSRAHDAFVGILQPLTRSTFFPFYDNFIEENMMSGTGLLIFLLVGAIAGWLAGLIVRGFGFGLIGNIVVGIIGAFFAGWLLPRLGVSFVIYSPLVTSIVYALIGAVILLAIIGVIRRA